MKTEIPLPIIRPDQYKAFRGEMGTDLPNTQDEFAELIKNQRNEALRRGEIPVPVDVEFHEFKRFCGSRGTKPNAKTLTDFAIEKRAGKKY